MFRTKLNREWDFYPGLFKPQWGVEASPQKVDLPHDFIISMKRDEHVPDGQSSGFFPGGQGYYEKKINIPAEWKTKKIALEFEGVYMNAMVSINHNLVTRHPYGYTSFHSDLTPWLKWGEENIIHVSVNNPSQSSRWYSGAGIYRSVWLLVGETVHIAPWGIHVTTPLVGTERSQVDVAATIENIGDRDQDVLVRSRLLDKTGKAAAFEQTSITINAGEKKTCDVVLNVEHAQLWSVDNPYLYTLETSILQGELLLDQVQTSVGIRSVAVDSKHGFRLNGTTLKLKGGCVHHDCGPLGAAAYERAEERKVELHKKNGFNAIRCAHNPPSPAFLDACDRLGILVINEAFDGWRVSKNSNDYGMFFDEWWQRDVHAMVVRDRNHPCVIMWSTGNEVAERNGSSNGYQYSKLLATYIRELDCTRPITHAINGFSAEDPTIQGLAANLISTTGEQDTFGIYSYPFVHGLDVVGYNYLITRYEMDGATYPERVICGTETLAMESFDSWELTVRLPYVIGDFVWTSLDYLGEVGIGRIRHPDESSFWGSYPWLHAYCGDMDICGFKRPQSHYRDCLWGNTEKPYIAVYNPESYGKPNVISAWGWPDVEASWTWPGYEGSATAVEIYSTSEEVELFVNGKSMGRRPSGKHVRYKTIYDLVYTPGELLVIAFNQGVEVSRTALETTDSPHSIVLTPDRSLLRNEYGDLCYVTVEVLDCKGRKVHHATDLITFDISGVGEIAATGSGDPVSVEQYTASKRHLYKGRALVIIKTTGACGEIRLAARADNLNAAAISVIVNQNVLD